jgi:pSer/pThr/pTyr-binding forkhead associated (FHA) protein
MIGDSALSRKHCAISQVSAGVYEISDLESYNGTFVNGIKITRTPIQHGDRICVGTSEFVFLTGQDDHAGPRSSGAGEQTASDTLSTLFLDQRSGLPSNSSGIGRMARDLSAFFKIANLINSFRDADTLQRELLGLISEVIPAAHGAIVLPANASEEPNPPCTWNRDGDTKQKMVIREEWAQRAMWERCAVFTTSSTVPTPDEHVLCAPLVGVENILGVIYLTSPPTSPPFGEDHAFFLSSVSRIAAVSLENLLKLDSLRAENQRLRADMGADTSSARAERCRGSPTLSDAWPRAIPRCLFAGRAEPVKSWWLAPFMPTACVPVNRLLPSTALRFRKHCWRASCLGMKRELSPARL